MCIHPIIVGMVLGIAFETTALFLLAIHWDEKKKGR